MSNSPIRRLFIVTAWVGEGVSTSAASLPFTVRSPDAAPESLLYLLSQRDEVETVLLFIRGVTAERELEDAVDLTDDLTAPGLPSPHMAAETPFT